jgi:hypothetical protein
MSPVTDQNSCERALSPSAPQFLLLRDDGTGHRERHARAQGDSLNDLRARSTTYVLPALAPKACGTAGSDHRQTVGVRHANGLQARVGKRARLALFGPARVVDECPFSGVVLRSDAWTFH